MKNLNTQAEFIAAIFDLGYTVEEIQKESRLRAHMGFMATDIADDLGNPFYFNEVEAALIAILTDYK